MSVAQVQEILRGALQTGPVEVQPNKKLFYFAYGTHLSHVEFMAKYPGAKVLGMGYLDGWTWHVNALGEPNIRPNLIQQKGVIVDCPSIFPATGPRTSEWMDIGTFGYIFLISQEIESKLDREYRTSRIKVCQDLKLVMRSLTIGPEIRMQRCITHFDPRNTADGYQNIWSRSANEGRLWRYGIYGLQLAGVPDWYISIIYRQLIGLAGNSEPIGLTTGGIHAGGTAPILGPFQGWYGNQKPVDLPNRQMGMDLPHMSHKLVQSLPARAATAHPQGRSSSGDIPVRRVQASLLPPGWHPQIRSLSAAVPQRFQHASAQPLASQGHLQGEHLSVSKHNQSLSSSDGTSSGQAHARQPQGLSSLTREPTVHPQAQSSASMCPPRLLQFRHSRGEATAGHQSTRLPSPSTPARPSRVEKRSPKRPVPALRAQELPGCRSSFRAPSARPSPSRPLSRSPSQSPSATASARASARRSARASARRSARDSTREFLGERLTLDITDTTPGRPEGQSPLGRVSATPQERLRSRDDNSAAFIQNKTSN